MDPKNKVKGRAHALTLKEILNVYSFQSKAPLILNALHRIIHLRHSWQGIGPRRCSPNTAVQQGTEPLTLMQSSCTKFTSTEVNAHSGIYKSWGILYYWHRLFRAAALKEAVIGTAVANKTLADGW